MTFSKVAQLLFLLFFTHLAFPSAKAWTPIVLWHGFSHTCCEPLIMGKFIQALKEGMPGVYIKSIMIGNNEVDDLRYSYQDSMNRQVSLVCKMIANDPNLKDGYNVLGYSQGGLLVRGVIQRCPSPPVKVFVSYASPQQGVFGVFETCPDGLPPIPCNAFRTLSTQAYMDYTQKNFMPAQYWHDPRKEDLYLAKSAYLADINNERSKKNQTYVDNLLKLEMLILVTHEKDGVVIPRESCSFGYYKPGQDKEILPMNQTRLYIEDWIGLKKLDQSGKVRQYLQPGEHVQINPEWVKSELVEKYFKKY